MNKSLSDSDDEVPTPPRIQVINEYSGDVCNQHKGHHVRPAAAVIRVVHPLQDPRDLPDLYCTDCFLGAAITATCFQCSKPMFTAFAPPSDPRLARYPYFSNLGVCASCVFDIKAMLSHNAVDVEAAHDQAFAKKRRTDLQDKLDEL